MIETLTQPEMLLLKLANIKVYTNSELLLLLQKTIEQNREEFNRLADRLKYYQEELPTFRNFLCNNNINISTEAFSI